MKFGLIFGWFLEDLGFEFRDRVLEAEEVEESQTLQNLNVNQEIIIAVIIV